MQPPRFSPEFNWGHVMQVVAVVVMIGGGSLTVIFQFKGQLAETDKRIAVLETTRTGDQQFQSDTRTALARLLDMITDLKIQLAKQERPPR